MSGYSVALTPPVNDLLTFSKVACYVNYTGDSLPQLLQNVAVGTGGPPLIRPNSNKLSF
jgi:hypothetical protein